MHDEDLYCDVLVCIYDLSAFMRGQGHNLLHGMILGHLVTLLFAEVLGCKVTWVLQYSISLAITISSSVKASLLGLCCPFVTTSEHFSSMVDVAQRHKLYHLIMFSLNESSMFFGSGLQRNSQHIRYIFTFFHIFI